jgi:hypothetical protein
MPLFCARISLPVPFQALNPTIPSPWEYFAECTESYFCRNDFFPFTRDELKQHNPEMFGLLEKLWGVKSVTSP